MNKRGFADVVELPVGQTYVHDGVSITATHAVHDGRREPFGPRADAIGYLIVQGEGANEASVYFAGDTDLWPGMADLHPQLDVALIPVWGWGTNKSTGFFSEACSYAYAAGMSVQPINTVVVPPTPN